VRSNLTDAMLTLRVAIVTAERAIAESDNTEQTLHLQSALDELRAAEAILLPLLEEDES
jgi:hypothetical protein